MRFTFRLINDSTLGSPIAGNLAGVDSVTVRDSLTAVVWYGRRRPEQFFGFVYNVAVLPEHLLDAPAVWLYEARNVSAVSRREHVTGTRPDAWWAALADWTVSSR